MSETRKKTEEAVKTTGLTKSYQGRTVLKGLNLSVKSGTVFGLLGANGAGKSTMAKLLCGFEKPDSGKVYVRGKQLGKGGRDFPENMGVFINSPGFIPFAIRSFPVTAKLFIVKQSPLS